MTELTRDLLLHPTRLRIVQALVGRRLTTLELKAELSDIAQATLYRQIDQLVNGGLIEVVEERRVQGGVERTYSVVESAASIGADDLVGATADDHLRYFVTFLAALLNDYASYLEASDLDLVADRVGYRQVPLWLTDAEFDDMTAEMSKSVRARTDNQPTPDRRRRLITSIVMPVDSPSKHDPGRPDPPS